MVIDCESIYHAEFHVREGGLYSYIVYDKKVAQIYMQK